MRARGQKTREGAASAVRNRHDHRHRGELRETQELFAADKRPGEKCGLDERVEQGFQPTPLVGIPEYPFAQFGPVQRPALLQDAGTETSRDFAKGRLPGIDHAAGSNVGVGDVDAKTAETVRHGALAAADPTGDADHLARISHQGP